MVPDWVSAKILSGIHILCCYELFSNLEKDVRIIAAVEFSERNTG